MCMRVGKVAVTLATGYDRKSRPWCSAVHVVHIPPDPAGQPSLARGNRKLAHVPEDYAAGLLWLPSEQLGERDR